MPPKSKPEDTEVPVNSATDGNASSEAVNPPVQHKGAGLLDPDAPSGVLTTATIIVRGPAKGRWRIGRHFGPEPVSIPEADLTNEQKHALANDPELLIQLIDPAY